MKTSASLLCQNPDYVMELKRFCFFLENQSRVDDSEWLSENIQFFIFCLHDRRADTLKILYTRDTRKSRKIIILISFLHLESI